MILLSQLELSDESKLQKVIKDLIISAICHLVLCFTIELKQSKMTDCTKTRKVCFTMRRIRKNRVVSSRVIASNNIVKIENALNNMVGQPVKKAMDYLSRFGFDNTELNGQDGYRKTSGINQYDTWAGYEDESGNYVKLYYTMVRDPNRGRDAFVGGKLRGVYVDGYDVEASTRTRKRSITAAESYGWVVESYEANEAYDLAAEYFGEEDLNAQIVKSLGSDELAACLAFIFRMNDFREWDEYKSGDTE